MLTDNEYEKALRIFCQIVPAVVRSVQFFDEMHPIRTYYIIGIPAFKKNYYNCLYLDIENITPWQLKTFNKRVLKDLPGKAFIEKNEDFTRLGFRA